MFRSPDGSTTLLCDRKVPLGSATPYPRMVFVNDRLAAFLITVETHSYGDLRAVTIEKYGEPTARDTEEYTTGGGVRVSGEVLVWSWPSGTSVVLKQRFGEVSAAGLVVSSKAYTDHMAAAKRIDMEKAKKAF